QPRPRNKLVLPEAASCPGCVVALCSKGRYRITMDKIMTRRTLVRAACAGVGAAAGVRIQSACGATPTNATAFALCGDESHNSDYIRTALTGTLVEDGGLSVDFSDQEKLL